MLCYSNFPGDDDERLFHMQNECYSEAIWLIVNTARKRYLDAETVLRQFASMSIQVRQVNSIDHRTVQAMHDLIAAWYRFKRRSERLFSLGSNLNEDWLAFFLRSESTALSWMPGFVTGVLDACVYANTEVGYAGESRALNVLRGRYDAMFRHTLPSSQPDADVTLDSTSSAD
jgi:hypothetical protein